MQIPASQKADQSSQELSKSQGKEGIQMLPVLVSILSIAQCQNGHSASQTQEDQRHG